MLQKFFKKIERLIEKTENSQIKLSSWLLILFCLVFVRGLLEVFSSRINIFDIKHFYFFFFHAPAYYLYVFLFLILFLFFLTKEKIEKITKTSLFVAVLILLPALIDIAAGRGAGIRNIYYFPTATNLFEEFLFKLKYGVTGLFLGIKEIDSPSFAVNYGIRIEVLILALLIIFYVFLKTKNPIRIILSFLLLNPLYQFIGLLPFFLQKIAGVASLHNVSTLNTRFEWNFILFSVYLILIVIFASIWFFIYRKEKFIALVKNLRLFRTLQILAMLFFGLYLAHALGPELRFFDFLLIATACLSLIFYWTWAVLSNDLNDEKSDRITNPDRPLPAGKLSREEVKSLSVIFLIFSYISALAVGYAFFIAVFIRSCLAYLYSYYPFRLKRFPILATFVLALAALVTIFGGYLLPQQNSIYNFPFKVILLVLLAFTLGFSAKDIKDYQGDKEEGVKTIPVIFGLERGKKIIGGLSFICFLLPPIIFSQYFKPLIGIALIAGLLSYWLITKKQYSEKPLFLIYFSYGLFLVLTIFKP